MGKRGRNPTTNALRGHSMGISLHYLYAMCTFIFGYSADRTFRRGSAWLFHSELISSLFNSHLFDFTRLIYVLGVGVAGGMSRREQVCGRTSRARRRGEVD